MKLISKLISKKEDKHFSEHSPFPDPQLSFPFLDGKAEWQ